MSAATVSFGMRKCGSDKAARCLARSASLFFFKLLRSTEIQERASVALNLVYLRLYLYHWADIAASQVVPEDIINQVSVPVFILSLLH